MCIFLNKFREYRSLRKGQPHYMGTSNSSKVHVEHWTEMNGPVLIFLNEREALRFAEISYAHL